MGVAGEIGQHVLRSAERRLGIDDEGVFAQGAHPLGERTGVSERGQIPGEAEIAPPEGCFLAIEEDPWT